MADDISSTDFDFEVGRLDDLVSQQAWKLDHQLHVQFYKHAELDSFASEKAGRKIFVEKVYVRILTPANRLNVIEREATPDDRQRFRNKFVAFVERGEQLVNGSPLGELPTISQAQVMELRALKIDTIEQLAGLPDTTAQLLGTGGQELKQRAIRYLDQRGDNATLSEANRALGERVKELERLVQANLAASTPKTDIKVSATTVAPPA